MGRRNAALLAGLYLVCAGLTLRLFLNWNKGIDTANDIVIDIPKDNKNNEAFEDLMASRRMRVSDECNGMKAAQNVRFSYNFGHLFVYREQHVVFCPVFKAATSTWFQLMVEMAPLPNVI